MFSSFPGHLQKRPRLLSRRGPAGEAALTGEGVLLLIIALGIVLFCAWLGWQYNESTEEEAHAYAERVIQRLARDHDARFLAANLSPVARQGYPPSQQKYVIASLTRLGLPSKPIKVVGSVSRGSDPGAQDPKGRFNSHLIYPQADAHFNLDIARRQGRWQIDLLAFEWKERAAPAGASSQ